MVNGKKRNELKSLADAFNISTSEMKHIIRDFHSEMERGLAGKKSSLRMIPACVDRPTGSEKGKFIALDLGGTNFRILELELKGGGRIASSRAMKFALEKTHITGSGEAFFDFIADCIRTFLEKNPDEDERYDLGFTFSFPVRQTGLAEGTLISWTKGFAAKGVIGRDVVRLLDDALQRRGVGNVRVSALANDTVGTLVAKGYSDRNCDIGVILGTGTNACYVEEISNIKKWHGPQTRNARMIINIEWGNFNRLPLTRYDREVDRISSNRGEQILEKMVSGMYLGEVSRLILKELIERGRLFKGAGSRAFDVSQGFKTEYMSEAEGDDSRGLSRISRLLRRLGILESSKEDRKLLNEICRLVSNRAARVSAAAIAAVVTKTDPGLTQRHTVAVDGSVYEKHPHFAGKMRTALKEIFGTRSDRIKMALAKDGSGKGAAIIAAVARSI